MRNLFKTVQDVHATRKEYIFIEFWKAWDGDIYTKVLCAGPGSGRLKRVLLTRKTAPGFEKCLGCFTRNVFTRGFDGEFTELNERSRVCLIFNTY